MEIGAAFLYFARRYCAHFALHYAESPFQSHQIPIKLRQHHRRLKCR